MAEDGKELAKRLSKMSDDELIRELAKNEDEMDDLVAAEYQRRTLREISSVNRRLSSLLLINGLMLVAAVAGMVWAAVTYAWWVESEGDWVETRRRSRESLEAARRSLQEGADALSAAVEDVRSEVGIGHKKKGWRLW